MLEWDELKQAVETKDLTKLVRNEAMSKKYAKFRQKILDKYESMSQFVVKEKMDGAREGMILLPNDFLYDLAPDIAHYVLWFLEAEQEEKPSDLVLRAKFEAFLEEHFDDLVFETILYVNPVEIQTVPEIPHAQVFVRFQDPFLV